MNFRYREMVYRPDFYHFHNDDRQEWLPNGIFNINVSRLMRDLAADDSVKETKTPWILAAVQADVLVEDVIRHSAGLGRLEEEHIQAADLERPLIFVEIAPDSFNLIDGHHRLEKARRAGIKELPAWFVDAHAAVHYMGSEFEYSQYVEYWNTKIERIDNPASYQGAFCPVPAPLKERDLDGRHIWKRMGACLNECRRVEVYGEENWFTLFRLNGNLFCGESEVHRPSIRCKAPFRITMEMVEAAAGRFEDWTGNVRYDEGVREKRKSIKKKIRHADVLMACVRVFSEY